MYARFQQGNYLYVWYNKYSMQDIRSASLSGKKVLLRTDFNVPLEDEYIEDAFRIDASVPTLRYLQEQGAITLIITHIGRPKGADKNLSLKPIRNHLQQQLQQEVYFFETLQHAIEQFPNLSQGDIALLENIRFEKGEQEDSQEFARTLASLGDVFVNDAFAVLHREHASVVSVPRLLPSYAGLLVSQEVNELNSLRLSHEQQVVFVMGGSKVQSKIKVIEGLDEIIDVICLGGVIANMFLKQKGYTVGNSYIEDEDVITKYLQTAVMPFERIILPSDVVVAKDMKGRSGVQEKLLSTVEQDDMILDIGARTTQVFVENIQKADVVFWNGPMGFFEDAHFQQGTREIVNSFITTQAKVIVGGGDAISALDQCNARNSVDYVCTGGGAMLKYLANGTLPGLKALGI